MSLNPEINNSIMAFDMDFEGKRRGLSKTTTFETGN